MAQGLEEPSLVCSLRSLFACLLLETFPTGIKVAVVLAPQVLSLG